ncbi:MAG: nucleotidyltransferase family protein [Bacteroides sp.]|nr:nucleotidyltransferase family protein [Bacteroides sp.]
MTIIQQQFFTLVQSGLWGTEADAQLFDVHTDWTQLYQSARAQALMGIVLDGIQTLPAEKRPPRMLYLQWCNTLLQIEEKNRLLNRELAHVYALCHEHGVEPVLLKGQGVAQNYRNPLHRQCGDIDLFTGHEAYQKVNSLLLPDVTKVHEECFKHIGFDWHGVMIENHRVLNTLNAPTANKKFQAEIARWYRAGEMRKQQVGDCTVSVPPLTFDAVYILIHSVLHALNEGIGLRQICDWACLLYHHQDTLDKDAVRKLLHEYGLEKAAKIFGVVAVEYLGLPAECLPISYESSDVPTGEWLMNDIWQEGNFGKFNANKKRRPKGYWSGKWHTLTQLTIRCGNMKRLAPAEARWYPVIVAIHSIQMQWDRLTGKQINNETV